MTAEDLIDKKRRGEKITVLTCYDYPTAKLEEAGGVDVLLVGDSVGTNVLGYANEREVTLDDMIHHVKAVVRGAERAYVVADMPYLTYESLPDALDTALHLTGVGANAVKMEGFRPEITEHLAGAGIDVWGHLGYNPQVHEKAGLQAKTAATAIELVNNCSLLEAAGAKALVLEMVPEEVARVVTQRLSIPTIGIGAGRFTDGQVLVINDVLGINPFEFRHSRKYEDLRMRITDAVSRFVFDVKTGAFPGEENVCHLSAEEEAQFSTLISEP